MPVSIREIARQTGLSTATVSQALRGLGRISMATRERVLQVARASGYRKDSLLAKAFARVRLPRAQRRRETVAVILEWETETSGEYQKRIYKGIVQRAESIGYSVESFILSGSPAEHRRLSRTLTARGIRGLIIVPRVGSKQPRLDLEWESFAAVEIGRTLWSPRNLHHVITKGYQGVLEALHLLKKVGYRRIGMLVEPIQNAQSQGIYYSAYLLSQMHQQPRQQIPIFAPTGGWNEKNFRLWMEKYSPDVLFIHRIMLISSWLKNMNLKAPEDISLFCTNAQWPALSGAARDYVGIGSAAVDMLSLLIINEELGLPDHPRSIEVSEIWQAGTTLSRSIADYVSDDGCLLYKPIVSSCTPAS